MRRLVFSETPMLKSLFLFENDRLIDAYVEPLEMYVYQGIYVGRVVNYVSSLKAYFVDIGYEKNGLLSHYDVIGRLKPGQTVPLQIKRPAVEDKGPKLTMRYQLAGNEMVYLPYSKARKASSELEGRDLEPYHQLLERIFGKDAGWILRSHLGSLGSLKEEALAFRDFMEDLDHYRVIGQVGDCLYRKEPGDEILEKWLADTDEVVVKAPAHKRWIQKTFKVDNLPIKVDPDAFAIDKYQLDRRIQGLLGEEASYPGGMSLYLEEGRTLTAIDVNSASNASDKVYAINEAALEESALWLKMREVSGVILIDLINLTDEEEERMLKRAEEIFAKDRVKVDVLGFTRTGLLEIIRQKKWPPLSERLTEEQWLLEDGFRRFVDREEVTVIFFPNAVQELAEEILAQLTTRTKLYFFFRDDVDKVTIKYAGPKDKMPVDVKKLL